MQDIFTPVTFFKKSLQLEEYAFRIENWFNGKKLGPLRIDAELHRRCNLNCRMCVRRASPIDLTEESKRIELPTKRWIELVKESGELKVKAWNISGIGEPMCKPETLLEVMETIKAYDMFGEVTTNGTLWREEDVKRVVEMNWDSICISIDAPDAKTHDYIRRVKGTFKKATKTVRLFRKWRDKFGQEVPCITINMVLNRLNYAKLPEMVKLAYKLGADALFAEPMIVYTALGDAIKITNKEMKKLPEIIKRTQELSREYNIATTITCVTPEKEIEEKLVEKISNIREILLKDAKENSRTPLNIPCYYPWLFLMIRADGSAIHCGECKKISDNVKNKSLKEVWFGDVLEKIRLDFLKGNLPKYCEMCRPNVIEDMREIRRSIIKYSDKKYLQSHILDLLKENILLQRQLFRLREAKGISQKKLDRFQLLLQRERELLKFKKSLSYKIGKKIGNTFPGKIIKRLFGIYV